MIDFVKVDLENLNYWYYNANGNLYFRDPEIDTTYQVLEDFSVEETRCMLKGGIEFIWIKGMSLGTNVEV
jgi:hypothetical protein